MDKEFLLKTTKKLITFKSTKDKPIELLRCIKYIEKLLPKEAYVVIHKIKGKPSLVATHRKTKKPEVFLHGHIDVIPAESKQFKPTERAGKLYGRGSGDMKSGMAVLIDIFNSNPDKNIGLMVTSDEETGGYDGALPLVKKGYRSKFVISGECTNGLIGNEAKGIIQLELKAKGKQAHSAYCWNGLNANHVLARSITAIDSAFNNNISKKDCWETSANFNIIAGGDMGNTIPALATAYLDIRYIPQEDPDKILARVKKLSVNTEVRVIFNEPSVGSSKSNKYIQLLSHEVTEKNKYLKKHGGSDVRHFYKNGIEGIVFGPDGYNLHGDNEYVKINSIYKMHKRLNAFIKKL